MNAMLLGYDSLGRKIYVGPDQRRTHMHVIGSSGSGKSKFLEWLIRGDIMNRQGFCLIDPHGTLYDDIVRSCSHHVLDRDIILLNLSQPDWVIGFNPFSRWPDGDVAVQVEARIEATMHGWNAKNTDETPTLARNLRALYTVLVEKGLALSDARHLLNYEDRALRGRLVDGLESALIGQEWQELLQLSRREWRDEILSAKNRLFRYIASPSLCRFMSKTPVELNIQQIIDEGKILLVNLRRSDYLSHENARVFGALLVNEFFEAAFRRSRVGGRRPEPYLLYLDEFQNFVSLDIADMLDQVRKFGLFLTLAHQRFGQIDENVAEAALSHCRIKAVFGGLTVPNARRMAEELFIGKLDPKRIKAAIYQTKFWPEYRRDKVYAKGTAWGTATADGSQQARGSFGGYGMGDFYQAPEWFGHAGVGGTSTSWSTGASDVSGSSQQVVTSDVDSLSEADIPIFFPVPQQELTGQQFYSIDEQLTELTAALKRQFERHCFIEIHDTEAQPMLVPFVDDPYTPPSGLTYYVRKLAQKAGAISREESDRLLAEAEAALRAGASVELPPPTSETPEDFYE